MRRPERAGSQTGMRARQRLRQWVGRHPAALSTGTASAAAAVLYAVAAPLEIALYGVPVVAGLTAPALQCASLVLALRFRIVAIVVFSAAAVALSLSTLPSSAPWPWTMTGIVCFALLVGSVWAASGWRYGLAAYVVPVAAVSVPVMVWSDADRAAGLVVALGVGAAAVVVGVLLRERTRIAREWSRERERAVVEVERRVVIEERQRIARELHDVVAHGLSLIQVQARFARYRLPHMHDDVAAEVEDIARTAGIALIEMRQMLGALRGDEPAARSPQPTLDGLPALVDDAKRAGAEVRLQIEVPHAMPTAVSIAAYRIAQEAISNAVRHAPGSPIHVLAGPRDGSLVVTIENGAAVSGTAERTSTARGHGLIGMRERAAMLHGTLLATPTPGGGFRVSATMPLDDQPMAGMQDGPIHAEGRKAPR